ncbi:hypothetical protein SAMN05880582_106200 [Rhizobium sp. RU20A]|uniref:DUF1284 domain-containing protein n=1 Tax=Rhizobium sp. RU20A TaxID=1907412 RepID=UPI0009554443|nr:DUF1284 domain-containing protein [Rhizobium sp. RU20A]SIR10679.1 hypothetical protein SAMN05880582_106200 [Rhizobium sp. RU20A]
MNAASSSPAEQPVRLRAHHLLCMLTFIGEGYSPTFVAEYRRIVARLGAGAEIEIVAGPDDICAPICHAAGEHCHNESVQDRDRRAAASVTALLGIEIAPGARFRLDAARLSRLRHAFATGTIRAACADCEWAPLCDGIAASGFEGVLLACRA